MRGVEKYVLPVAVAVLATLAKWFINILCGHLEICKAGAEFMVRQSVRSACLRAHTCTHLYRNILRKSYGIAVFISRFLDFLYLCSHSFIYFIDSLLLFLFSLSICCLQGFVYTLSVAAFLFFSWGTISQVVEHMKRLSPVVMGQYSETISSVVGGATAAKAHAD